MKKVFICLFTLFAISASAQDCANYYYLQNNATVELALYDKKNKEVGKVVYRISGVNKSGKSITSTIHSEIFDEKGKSMGAGDGMIKCNGGIISVSMEMSMPGNSMDRFKGMEVKSNQAYMDYPAGMQVGDALQDGNLHMDISNNGKPYSQVDYTIKNRKVGGKEKVTTPAGTWDCFKINYDAEMKIKMMGIGIPMHMNVTEWFAPGFGLVKTESLNKKGKLMGSTILKSVSK